jgi:hypothetical protein
VNRGPLPSSAKLDVGRALLFAALVGIVVLMYLRLASVLPYGQVSRQAALAVDPPFLYRFLLPWTLGQLLPSAWLDTLALRAAVTTLSVAVCFWLFPAYAARALGSEADGLTRPRLWMGLAVVLLAHYGIPRPYCFWYIYDIPAIAFYMMAFLAMTQRQGHVAWWCVPMLAVMSLNRETIVVAVFHAAAWHGWRMWRDGVVMQVNVRAMARVALPPLAALVAVVLLRSGLVHWLGQDAASVAYLNDGEQLRIVAGFARMLSKPDHALALLLIGAGALVWLPWRWRHLPASLRVLLLASLPALAMFLAVGNVVELRMYGELVPVLVLGATSAFFEPRAFACAT